MEPRRFKPALVVALALAVVGTLNAGCSSSSVSAGPPPPRTVTYSNLEGTRFCELVIVNHEVTGYVGSVYSTFPINSCPDDEWKALNPTVIAKEDGGLSATLSGPRFWLMDSISRYLVGEQAVTTTKMGKITMHQTATVHLGSLNLTPYSPVPVDREATSIFRSGQQIYELTDPSHHRWVMESWSQGVDPALRETDLAGLAGKLFLPPGWSYSTRRLTAPLVIATTQSAAHVVQDNLANNYALEVSASR